MKVIIKNIGGLVGENIFELKEGVNEVLAPNAGGKSSFVRALLAVLNPNDPNIRPEDLLNLDADEGYIRVEIDGQEYYRVFKRLNGKVVETASKPMAMDERFSWLLLDPFIGRLVLKILSGGEDITDFIDLTFELSKLRREIEARRAMEEELRIKREELLEKSIELARLVNERNEIESKLKALEMETRKIEIEKIRIKEEIERTIMELKEKIGELSGKLETYKKELEEAEERAEDLEAKIKALEEQVDSFYRKYPDPNQVLKSIDEEIDRIRRIIEEHNAKLQELYRINPVLVDAVRLKPAQCPVCGRAVEDPDRFWRERASKLDEAIREIEESIREYKARELEELNKKGALESELTKIRNIEVVELPSLRRRLELERTRIEKYKENIETIEAQIRVLRERIQELESRIPEEERKRMEEQLKIVAEKKALEEYLEGIKRRLESLGDIGKQLEDVEKKLAEVMREREELEKRLYKIRSTVALEFRRLANEIVSRLGFGWFKSIVLDEMDNKYFIRVVRKLPSGREEKQSIRQLSTSEKVSIALTAVLAGYKLIIAEEYPPEKVIILADEALLAFDPDRYERVIEELKQYGRYIIVTRLTEPMKTQKLTIIHKT